ncbi:cysteine-rich receptor-like protein kinase 8, partial [Tanacetum coccineum]
NSDHPLFLHQTDHPGLILISKKLTGSDIYSSWKRSMLIALNAKNKMKLVIGEYPEPAVDSTTRDFGKETMACSFLGFSILLLNKLVTISTSSILFQNYGLNFMSIMYKLRALNLPTHK